MSNRNLVGPKPPERFICDGCTMAPDGWWYEACKVHDYEYSLMRPLYAQLNTLRARCIQLNDERLRDSILVEIGLLETRIRSRRKKADENLRENMRRLSGGSRFKAAFAWWISRHYYRAVRVFGHSILNKTCKPNEEQ